jgi:hypothetical protein
MQTNPLTTTALVFAIGDAYTIWDAIVTRNVPVFTAIAWALSFVFFFLYLKRSPFAGAFLIYSTLPLYPLYLGLKLVGLSTPPPTPMVYLIMFAIYAVAVTLVWKLKRDYDRYVAENQSTPTS